MDKVLTSPIAIIKAQVGSELRTIGRMRNLRVTETFRRIDVKGIGELFPIEKAPVDWQGSLTCQSFMIDLQQAGLTGAPNRLTNDVQKFANTLLLDEQGIDVYIYKKIKETVNPTTGIVETVLEELIAAIRGCYVEREGFDITDGQVSGRDQDFTYINPVLFE